MSECAGGLACLDDISCKAVAFLLRLLHARTLTDHLMASVAKHASVRRYLWEKVETQRLQMMQVRDGPDAHHISPLVGEQPGQPMDACADRHSAVLDCFAVASDGLY